MRELEKQVLGCDFGGTSWTTRIQAEKIPAALGLRKGVSLLERADLTDEYLGALSRLVSGLEKGADTLSEVLGEEGFIDQLARRRSQVAAIEDGLLQRESFLARADYALP